MTRYITQSTLSKAFALLLIEVHEMIDNFSGVETVGGREGNIMFFCHRRHAVMNLFFLKDGQVSNTS